MPESALQKVLTVLPETWRSGADLKQVLDDDDFWPDESGVSPDAPITFVTPDGGLMGGMGGPFFGPEGLRAGWLEWLRPFDKFTLQVDEALESDDGTRALLLVMARGTLAGSATTIDQPSAALYRVDGDRIVAIDHFLDHDQARRAFEDA